MIITAIDLPIKEITEFCDRWQVVEFALFGSVLRDDFLPDSDVDVMVEFAPDAHPIFTTLEQMEEDLQQIFHRDIDLITRKGTESIEIYYTKEKQIYGLLCTQPIATNRL